MKVIIASLLTALLCFGCFSTILSSEESTVENNIPLSLDLSSVIPKANTGKFQKPDSLHVSIFDYWKNINSRCVGIISIPELGIEEPCLRSDESNSEWLRTNIRGEYDVYGTIFLDYRTDMESAVRMIHGHNSKDGNYFSDLEKYLREESCEHSPEIYFYGKDFLEKYKVFAILSVKSKEETISLSSEWSKEEIYYLVESLKDKSFVTPCEAVSPEILILNSCWYGESGQERNLKCLVAAAKVR